MGGIEWLFPHAYKRDCIERGKEERKRFLLLVKVFYFLFDFSLFNLKKLTTPQK